ncbi:hypothetical protein [Spirosoma areae]
MVNKSEIWEQILFRLKSYADFLEHNIESFGEARSYVLSVRNAYDIAMKSAINKTESDVQTMSASTAGLSRYFDEFEWDSDTYETAKKYLNELAVLSVNLLNAYGL